MVARAPEPGLVIEYGDLLQSLGRTADAAAQYEVAQATQALFAANGVEADATATLFAADHGQPAEALASGEAGIRTRPFLAMQDAYAWALHANGRDAEAKVVLADALKVGLPSALFEYHAGMIDLALGDTAGARAHLSRALELNPFFSPLGAPLARQALESLGGALVTPGRWAMRLAMVAAIVGLGTVGFGRPASAHPLGNLSVNHYHGLTVEPDRLVDDAVVDAAEIPTVQAARAVDTDGDGVASPAELHVLRAATVRRDAGRSPRVDR